MLWLLSYVQLVLLVGQVFQLFVLFVNEYDKQSFPWRLSTTLYWAVLPHGNTSFILCPWFEKVTAIIIKLMVLCHVNVSEYFMSLLNKML